MDGYAEDFLKWLESFRSRTLEELKLEGDWTPKYHHDIIDKLNYNESANYEVWSDVYNPNNPGIAFSQFLSAFKDSFNPWIKIHRAIFKKADLVKSGDWILNQEEELGINLRAFAQS